MDELVASHLLEYRNPEDDTTAVDTTFLETTIINNRLYQSYAITNETYLAPIDQVDCPISTLAEICL